MLFHVGSLDSFAIMKSPLEFLLCKEHMERLIYFILTKAL